MSNELKIITLVGLGMFFIGGVLGSQHAVRMETKNRIEPDLSIQVVNGVPDTTFIYIKQD